MKNSMTLDQVIIWFEGEIAEEEERGNTGRIEVYENTLSYLDKLVKLGG